MAEANIQIGNRLQSARRKQKIRLHQAVEETCIPKRYISALEKNDAGALPEPVYALGFVKTYAEYLGLEAKPLIEEVKSQIGAEPQALPIPANDLDTPRRSWAVLAAGVLIAALLAAAAYLGWQYFKGPDYRASNSDDIPEAVAALLAGNE